MLPYRAEVFAEIRSFHHPAFSIAARFNVEENAADDPPPPFRETIWKIAGYPSTADPGACSHSGMDSIPDASIWMQAVKHVDRPDGIEDQNRARI